MRRAALAVTAGLLLLTASACGSDTKPEAAATETAPTAATPAATAPDYSASTKQVCTKLQTLYTAELRTFGTAMGKMVTYKENKQTADAEKAETSAAAALKAAATKIRTETADAEDPDFIAAGKVSASKLESSATDRRYFDTVKTLADLNKTVQSQFAEWLTPVAGYCQTAESTSAPAASPSTSS